MSGPHFIVTSTAREHAEYTKRKKKEFQVKVFTALILFTFFFGFLYYILDNGLLYP